MSVELCTVSPFPVSQHASRLTSESSCHPWVLAMRPSGGTCHTACTLLLKCDGLRVRVWEQANEPDGAVSRLVELAKALARPVQGALRAFNVNPGAGWQDRAGLLEMPWSILTTATTTSGLSKPSLLDKQKHVGGRLNQVREREQDEEMKASRCRDGGCRASRAVHMHTDL
jgi:hypothetical protein